MLNAIDQMTPESLQRLRHEERRSLEEIAQMFGVSKQYISQVMDQLGIETSIPSLRDLITNEELEAILPEELARKYGVSPLTIDKVRRERDIYLTIIPMRVRQDSFARSLFGKGYTGGPNFNDIVEVMKSCPEFSELAVNRVKYFYVQGGAVEEEETDSYSYRAYLREKMSKMGSFKEELLNRKVFVKNE